MAFVTDKSELKPGLVLFRRGDVNHRMWYCRMKIPRVDRYKTVSLKTTDIDVARERAFDQDADVRFRLKHDVPVFNHPFREVGREYLLTQDARAKRGEISTARPKKVRAIIEGALDRYVGSTQVHLIGDELWGGYRSSPDVRLESLVLSECLLAEVVNEPCFVIVPEAIYTISAVGHDRQLESNTRLLLRRHLLSPPK